MSILQVLVKGREQAWLSLLATLGAQTNLMQSGPAYHCSCKLPGTRPAALA